MTDETNITQSPEAPPFTIWGFLKRGFRGQEKLWQVFWIATIAVPQVAGVAIALLLVLFTIVLSMLHVPKFLILVMFFGILFTCFLYMGWTFVAIWRCAFNVKHRFWGYAARFYVVFVVLMLAAAVSLGGLTGWHSIQSEQDEFACKQYHQEYEDALKQGRGAEFADAHQMLGRKCRTHAPQPAHDPSAFVDEPSSISPAPQTGALKCPQEFAGFSLAGNSGPEGRMQCDYVGSVTPNACMALQAKIVTENGTSWCRKNDVSGATLSLSLKVK